MYLTTRGKEESRPASLPEILQSREDRARRQRELLDRYDGVVISFTPVAPGAEKGAPRFRRVFEAGRAAIEEALEEAGLTVLEEDRREGPAGFECLFALEEGPGGHDKLTEKRGGPPGEAVSFPGRVKTLMMKIEETHPLGRLFDIDVLGPGGRPLSRFDLGRAPRSCLLCGKPAAECARSGAHPLDRLLLRIDGLLESAEKRGRKDPETASLCETFAAAVAGRAYRAIMEEVAVTPKPGLVDRAGPGAHRDMDYSTFQASARVLRPWFADFVRRGCLLARLEPEEIFLRARPLGVDAEKAMFAATGGVNTHKGLVFSLGLLCVAAGALKARGVSLSAEALCGFSARMCSGIVDRELRNREEDVGRNPSHGERVFSLYGAPGVRDEAEKGFPTVLRTALPRMRDLLLRYPGRRNHVLLAVLLELMSGLEDTNVLTRGGPEALERVRRSAREALALGGPFTRRGSFHIDDMSRDFAAAGISPGGSADLLAVSIFLSGFGGGVMVSHFPGATDKKNDF